jgi:hypothetical protein
MWNVMVIHKPLVGSPNLPLGTKQLTYLVGCFFIQTDDQPFLRGGYEGIIMIQTFIELIEISDKYGNHKSNARPQT